MTDTDIVDHYVFGGLRDRIEAGLAAVGEEPTVDMLGAVDEFHIGGRGATSRLIDHVDLPAAAAVLDIGCGLGGTARHIVATTDAHVSGIDLAPEYIDVATWLSELVGLGDRVSFDVGSALDLPFGDASFDLATLVHVGMNIADKDRLSAEVARVLRPAGTFAIYDVMRSHDGELTYPVPWAANAATSYLSTPDDYVEHLEAAGFEVVAVNDRRQEATAFFDRLQAAGSGGPPPPLGLHLVMGPETPVKVKNMVDNVRAGVISPTEILARRVAVS